MNIALPWIAAFLLAPLALAQSSHPEDDPETLIWNLGSPDEKIASAAAVALRAQGSAARPELLAAIWYGDPYIAQRAHPILSDIIRNERSARGLVVDEYGNPVANVVITSNYVRHPDPKEEPQWHPKIDQRRRPWPMRYFGPLTAQSIYAKAITDQRGQFALYGQMEQFGDNLIMVPPGSTYDILMTPPPESGLFPQSLQIRNDEPVTIALKRGDKFRRFVMFDLNGAEIPPAQAAQVMQLTYRAEERSPAVVLAPSLVADGGWLLPGMYEPRLLRKAQPHVTYPAVQINDQSPDAIAIKPPPRVTLHGRVIDAVTGTPIAGAPVLATCSHSGNPLRFQITPENWEAIARLQGRVNPQAPEFAMFASIWGLVDVAVSDADGKFALQEPPDQPVGNIMAFAPAKLGYAAARAPLNSAENNAADVGDLPLFPGAYVAVELLTQHDRVSDWFPSVYARWSFAADDQPPWLARLREVHEQVRTAMPYPFYLQIGKQDLWVPAGAHLDLVFEMDDDQAYPLSLTDLNLAPGARQDFGALQFNDLLAVEILVTDPRGSPVPEMCVSALYERDDTWRVSQLTDKRGRAVLKIRPASAGTLSAGAYISPENEQALLPFKFGATAPAEPLVIPMSDEQIKFAQQFEEALRTRYQ